MSAQKEENAFQKISNSCCFFSNNYYKVLSEELKGNIVTSPFSLHVILSLLHHGTKGLTFDEFRSALYPADTDVSHEETKSLMSVLNDIKQVELQIANAIYIQDGFQILSDFLTVSTDVYNCLLSKTDFTKRDQAINEINLWVKDATKNKIPTVLSRDDIDDSTIAILVNAVYFKGHWLNKFDEDLTEKKSFHITKTNTKLVPMMFKKSKFLYGEISSLNAKFIEIPYLNQDIVMTVLLPKEIEGLQFLEKNFKWEDFLETSRVETKLELYLPRFKFEVTIDLKKILYKMGLISMFEDNANFSRFTDSSVKVSQAFQKAFIEVNEEGSEAAAATVVQMRLRRALIDITENFLVDRPFLFIIYHKPSKIPLFLGSVKDIDVPVEKDEL